jgi:hypothetical protein
LHLLVECSHKPESSQRLTRTALRRAVAYMPTLTYADSGEDLASSIATGAATDCSTAAGEATRIGGQ